MQFPMKDAEVVLYPKFFSTEESSRLLAILQESIPWKQEAIKLYGKTIPTPRLTAWHGDTEARYSYSNIIHEPEPWTPELLEIKRRIEPICKAQFNFVLLNFYREGRDSMSWHSDDEPELGANPIIGSVSFGAPRRFHFRHKFDASLRQSVDLTDGSLLIMGGATQHFWRHQLPKTARPIAPRINLTFRTVMQSASLSRRLQ